jgi:NAD(P)-dependent dehydrogenase (short-subunit alcohol dehydrogenase family)
MAGLLAGKVALVTGVSHEGQVGETVARALAAEGAALAIAARARDRVEARARDLAAGGARVLALAVDLTSESEVRKAVDQAAAHYGRIDVLVNLAGGLTRYKPAVEVTLDDWNHELGNNLLTAFLCARAVFPRLRDAGGGSIINFARAGLAQANMVAYNCAKAGVEALTRTLALEGRDHSIRVNAVAPGLVDTQSNIEAMKPKDMKKWARKEDVAAAVVFLASDAAAGVTGQTLAVTGWGV